MKYDFYDEIDDYSQDDDHRCSCFIFEIFGELVFFVGVKGLGIVRRVELRFVRVC